MPCARCSEATAKRDGYVSLEVSPYLRTGQKRPCSRRGALGAVDRPNLMIKVPAAEGYRQSGNSSAKESTST